jgi:hypothetical protein
LKWVAKRDGTFSQIRKGGGKTMTLIVGKFGQWRKEELKGVTGNRDVRQVIATDETLLVLADGQVMRWTKGEWQVITEGWAEPACRLLLRNDGYLWVSAGKRIGIWDERRWRWMEAPCQVTAWAEDEKGNVWVVGENALWRYRDGWERIARLSLRVAVRAIAVWRDQVALATSAGLWFLQGKRFHFKELLKGVTPLPTDDLRDVAVDPWGHWWLATDKGIVIFSDGDGWLSLTGADGLPIEDVRCLRLGRDGSVWLASSVGAMCWKDGTWHYFASRRWLPSDEVRDIAVRSDGVAVIATAEGIVQLYQQPMTLAEKAALFERQVRERHLRFGYVTVRRLERPGDVQSGRVEISDNDGLWTALYVAAECFRFAVAQREGRTAEAEEARQNAIENLKALLFLKQVTGIAGFPARAVRHKSEPAFGQPDPEWHPTADGEWEWKGDTSSDELVGHFFAYTIAYDLLPDEGWRQQVAATAQRITDHLIDNGFYLVDVDGQPTTWGVWSPEKLNHDATWWGDRGLNSLQLLAFLKATYHMTGDERYQRIYRDLIERHHYALNTVRQKIVVNGLTNHSDDELAFLSYYTLLRYETDPHLRRFFVMSLERTWQRERRERCPLWNFLYGALTGNHCEAEAAVKTLQEIPLDLVHWTVRNSHRADLVVSEELGRFGERQATDPLPFTERPLHKWNGNPYRLDGGADGLVEEDATFFLLPYWLARFHGLLAEASSP